MQEKEEEYHKIKQLIRQNCQKTHDLVSYFWSGYEQVLNTSVFF